MRTYGEKAAAYPMDTAQALLKTVKTDEDLKRAAPELALLCGYVIATQLSALNRNLVRIADHLEKTP